MVSFGIPIESAKSRTGDLNVRCRPPLPLKTVQNTVNSAYRRTYRQIKDQTVADWLDVTPREAGQLRCALVATRFRAHIDPAAPKLSRQEQGEMRMAPRHSAICGSSLSAQALFRAVEKWPPMGIVDPRGSPSLIAAAPDVFGIEIRFGPHSEAAA